MQDEFLRLQKLLKKTIIFITHDFEEAVRLGDRIGIMKDGELVQLATAEEMVTSPANDYVRAFTRNAPRERIVTIASLVDKSISASASPVIPSTTKIGDAAAQVLASDTPVGVVDDAGHMLGAVTRQQMIAALFTGQRA
jgi:glycine betaine/proline transport system ATP-binding protein